MGSLEHLAKGQHDDEVLITLDDEVLRIVLNRPQRLNALTAEMVTTLTTAISGARAGGARVVTISGSGRAFCAGAEVTPHPPDGEIDSSLVDAVNEMVPVVRACDVPVVALVNGLAVGVGMSLVLASDIAVGSSNAYLKVGFASIGLSPDGGSTAFLTAVLGRQRALWLAFLDDKVTADKALEWGLLSRVWEIEEFEQRAAELVNKLAHGPTQAFAETKAAIQAADPHALDVILERERAAQLRLVRSLDFQEAVAAFAAKRTPVFRGR